VGRDYTIGNPYYRTEVGDHENSGSPYGTFDQGGNVWEWNEAVIWYFGSYRGLRGGSYWTSDSELQASYRYFYSPMYEGVHFGFRVSEVPEPASMILILIGGIGLFKRSRK
jgi:formylglycine-generating enzyme required for sulfatase activity